MATAARKRNGGEGGSKRSSPNGASLRNGSDKGARRGRGRPKKAHSEAKQIGFSEGHGQPLLNVECPDQAEYHNGQGIDPLLSLLAHRLSVVSVGEITAALKLKRREALGLLRELEAEGLVEPRIVALTAKGRRKARKVLR